MSPLALLNLEAQRAVVRNLLSPFARLSFHGMPPFLDRLLPLGGKTLVASYSFHQLQIQHGIELVFWLLRKIPRLVVIVSN